MLGLGVWVHRKIGSRTLCDILHKIGSSVPYSLIQEYEKSAVIQSSLQLDPEAYIQFAFDNFDFYTATIDGHDTIHSMGGMIFVTPKTGVPPRGNLPRLTSETRKIPLAQYGVIALQPYRKPQENGLSHVTVTSADNISINEASSLRVLEARQFDLLWLIGNTAMPKVIPGWNGFMSSAVEGPPYALTATLPLPFVNLNPSDPSTIFTCLSFAADQAEKHGQKFIPVTFDQPLSWKAAEMVLASPQNSPLRKVVVRLGGFHLLMSFMGSIGHLMSGSGLEDLWATVYAKNSVQHMCSGKAYSRAVRAHFLAQTALLRLVLKKIFSCADIAPLRKTLLEMCRATYRRESNDFDSELLFRVLEKLETELNNLAVSSKTGRLWVQYVRQGELIRLLIRAERVGDWGLHLHAVKQMLPYFHSAGHLNYAKSAQLYLQLMAVAESSLPQPEHDRLCSQGFFSVRKNERLWSGNFSDQTIEMDLMRPMKSIGGITMHMHGRGITESTLAVWVGSMPYCSEIVQALEVFCGIARATSEQHADLRDSTISRDAEHLDIFTNWLESHSPFDQPSDKLVSLSSGLIANNSINCDRAYEIGCEAMEKHVGKPFSEVTFHRKDKALPISAMGRSVVIRDTAVQVNPTQLFHRIIVALKDPSALEGHFAYELAPFPTSLFDENGMRKTAKSKLVDAVESLFVCSDAVIPPLPTYIIDGGFLLRKVVWTHPSTYGEIIEIYRKHVVQFYGNGATVVFHGYPEGPTTKDQEHNLRSAAGTSADLSSITPEMVVSDTQARFLSNGKNKSLLIEMLTVSLRSAGVSVFQARADADSLVVSKAIEIAGNDRNCVVVGTDTDLLVLLAGLSSGNLPLHFLIPATGRTGLRVHHIQSIREAMGDAAPNILVAHVITGTDTVSALYMGQKKKALKLLCKPDLEEVITFLTPGQSPDTVAAAGEKILLTLYGCKDQPNLNKARYFLYLRIIARQSVRATFKLESLPPTTAGARQHSLRTYFQIQEWLGKELNPIEWGWKLDSSQYFPVTTLSPAAHKALLELISCNCRSGCGRGCSCVTAGLKCTNICGQCAGITCMNAEAALVSDEEDGEQENEDPDDPPSFAL
ncbi:Glycerophosphodiester phosphodiesterase [Frankliniella fusca]|uniref:Glycerophosphodiester phosphodiesterase n=1 Tax=Frankliniella fusca TaxID=407009 RepID=A0AAE1I1D5_9NEOP|nr:Glycerophosphodiester phosphodiesterase [Frankliniella fusca]